MLNRRKKSCSMARVALFAFILLCVCVDSAAAHEPGVVMTGFGTATIDGTLTPGEWDAARPLDFDANVVSGGVLTTNGQLLVMNDDSNLYLAVSIEKLPEPNLQLWDSLSVEFLFDNDHSNAHDSGDDVLVANHSSVDGSGFFDDFLYSDQDGNLNPFGAFDVTDPSPLPPVGTSDGAADGSTTSTRLFLELVHPLDSADDEHDFSVQEGDRLGFRMVLSLWTDQGDAVAALPLFENLGDIYMSRGMPETDIDSGPSGFVSSTAATFTFSGTQDFTAGFSCSLDAAVWSSCASPLELSALAQGAHTLAVRAEDEVGYADSSPTQASWTVDTVPPNTRIRSGPSGTVSSRKATFRFRSSEAVSTFRCKLDGHRWCSCTSPKTYTSLGRGPHVFRVKARDRAGNVDPTPAVRRWTIL
jgi:hypothetical protein